MGSETAFWSVYVNIKSQSHLSLPLSSLNQVSWKCTRPFSFLEGGGRGEGLDRGPGAGQMELRVRRGAGTAHAAHSPLPAVAVQFGPVRQENLLLGVKLLHGEHVEDGSYSDPG